MKIYRSNIKGFKIKIKSITFVKKKRKKIKIKIKNLKMLETFENKILISLAINFIKREYFNPSTNMRASISVYNIYIYIYI